jgi:hypothetical protein
MHRIILILMLVLLPLRGWTTDAMGSAMLMPVNPMPIAAQVEANAHTDCLGHETNEEVTAQGDDACPTCTLCQICHTVALSAPIITVSSAAMTFALPTTTLPRYASADPALRIKPPIS